METNSNEKRGTQNGNRSRRSSKNLSDLTTDSDDRISFISGNPSVELIEGYIHLYTSTEGDKPKLERDSSLPVQRSEIVCIVSVPSRMTHSDISSFVGVYGSYVAHMRIITNASTKGMMVIVKLKNQKNADDFWLEFNQKPFNSMEPDHTCRCLFVSSVEFTKPIGNPNSKLRRVMQAFPPPPEGLTELPTCPVCLDTLDESSSGIVTVLCNHSFHCTCLSKWKGDASCPVCRYRGTPEETDSPECAECGTLESLWICLICGHVGCGRYVQSHAGEHYKETLHAFALDLSTSRVWDYAKDTYVHRLIQNKEDGSLIPVGTSDYTPSEHTDQPHLPQIGHVQEGKIESISLEYTHLLEAQRRYFQEQIQRIERQKTLKLGQLEDEYALLSEQLRLQHEKLKDVEEDKRKWEKKYIQLDKKNKDLSKETQFLHEINDSLKLNVEEWRVKLQEEEKKAQCDPRDAKIQELEAEIADLMFFIEGRKNVENNPELQGGNMVFVENPNASPQGSPARRKPVKKTNRR